MRVVLWSQHLLGTGHLRRSERLAEALAARGATVVLVNGGPAAPAAPGLDYHRLDLPALRSADAAFSGLVDERGVPPDEAAWRARADLLNTALEGSVEVFVVELFPFGRRAFARELLPVLEHLHARRPRPLCLVSLRDVLVAPKPPERAALTLTRVRRWFDHVLVHGDPRLIPLEASFPAAAALGDLVAYTGYVAPPPRAASPGAGVLVSAGGGAVGGALVETALRVAERLATTEAPWTVITGRHFPDATFRRFAGELPAATTLLRAVDDFPRHLSRAALSVSQAGYNTVIEALALGRRMVLVPFAFGNETEQTMRARAVERAGAAGVINETDLSPDTLEAAVRAALERPSPRLDLALDGAATSARLIETWVASER